MEVEVIGVCRSCGGNVVKLGHNPENGLPNMFVECLTCHRQYLASDDNAIIRRIPLVPREELFGQKQPRKIDISTLEGD